MKILRSLFVFFLSMGLYSCNNDILPENENMDANVSTESFILKVDYCRKSYDVPCLLLVEKDSIIFLDDDFKELFFNEISKIPNLVCNIKANGRIEYINANEVDSIDKSNYKQTRVAPSSSDIRTKTFLHFWVDTKYRGAAVRAELTSPWQHWEVANLGTIGWDNEISSFIITNKSDKIPNNVLFLGYESSNYKGECLRYEVSKKSGPTIVRGDFVEIPSLKELPMSDGRNWNDELSSIKFYSK